MVLKIMSRMNHSEGSVSQAIKKNTIITNFKAYIRTCCARNAKAVWRVNF